MRVLVTGGTGFIGRHLVRRLVGLGDEVACFVRRSSEVEDLERMGVEFRYGDVTDFESVRAAVRDVDAVYHLAGVIRTVGQGDMPAVNEGGTANLVKACAQLETPPAVVFVSSIAATGPSRDGPLVESDKPEPVSLYGRSKLAAERAARRWSGEVPVTTIRPPIVFGEHDKETLELFRMADRGWHVIPGLKARRVSLVHASDPELFRSRYEGVEQGPAEWNALEAPTGDVYAWDAKSTYIQEPPFFEGMENGTQPIQPITGARALLLLGDSVTTDHISPAGAIEPDHTAGTWLQAQGVKPWDFNSFGSRRGNDRVMARGTFANIRLRNQLAPGTEGGWTTHLPTGEVTTVYDGAQRYAEAGTPLVVLAGKDYGMGSSRDWAAKGTKLLGARAVIAVSYERIHRSNLVGMGVLPLQLADGDSFASLGITGRETFDIPVTDDVAPGQTIVVTITDEAGAAREIELLCRIDTPAEVGWYREGGILNDGLRKRLS